MIPCKGKNRKAYGPYGISAEIFVASYTITGVPVHSIIAFGSMLTRIAGAFVTIWNENNLKGSYC